MARSRIGRRILVHNAHPVSGEANAATPAAHEHPVTTPERTSEPEAIERIDAFDQPSQPLHDPGWSADKSSDGLKSEEQTTPVPDHSLASEAGSPSFVNAEEETAQVALG